VADNFSLIGHAAAPTSQQDNSHDTISPATTCFGAVVGQGNADGPIRGRRGGFATVPCRQRKAQLRQRERCDSSTSCWKTWRRVDGETRLHAAATRTNFLPKEPETLADTQLTSSFVVGLILKLLLARGDVTGRQVSEHLRLPFRMLDELLREIKLEANWSFTRARRDERLLVPV